MRSTSRAQVLAGRSFERERSAHRASPMRGWFSRRLRMRLRGAAAVSVCVLLANGSLAGAASNEATERGGERVATSVIDLLRDGQVSVELSAKDAHHLTVQLHNRTEAPIHVDFPPGLVADGFAQNQVLAQGLGQRQGFGQGVQGLGMLESQQVELGGNQAVALAFRSACLNFGVAEPKAKDPLFLKTVEEYTPDPRVRATLAYLARHDVDTESAQAALWHVTDGMSWQRLSGQGIRRGRPFSAAQLARARQWVDQCDRRGQESSGVLPAGGVATPRSPALALTLNPDPRGSSASLALTRDLARRLAGLHPRVCVSHRNYAADSSVQWSLLVQTPALQRRPMVLTLMQSWRDPDSGHWQHGSPESVRLNRPAAKASQEGEWLAQELISQLAARAIHVEWQGRAKSRSLLVRNEMPLALSSVTVGDRRDSAAQAQLSSVEIPAGATVSIPLSEAEGQQLAKARHLQARGFALLD